MKKTIFALLISVSIAGITVHFWKTGPRPLSKEKIGQLSTFIKHDVADTLEQDYRGRGIPLRVAVTAIRIDSITETETAQDHVYFTRGSVSYFLRGRKIWKDKDGNVIQLGTGQEMTHWFTCGVLEDKYLGTLFNDRKNSLTFYAEKPEQ